MTSCWGLGLSSPYTNVILTLLNISRFFDHHSFLFLSLCSISSSFLGTFFCHLCWIGFSQLKCPNVYGVYTLFSSIFLSSIREHVTCKSHFIFNIPYVTRYPAECWTAIRFSWTSVCVLTGDYILLLLSDKTVQCRVLYQCPPHKIVYITR